ncbi:MAG: hypothetical protein ABSB69_06055 [Solirubrobacteraceae bacterium]
MSETVTSVLTNRVAWPSSFAGRLATFARTHRRQIELALATTLYLGFACYLTWPLATNLSHSIYGAPGDPYGTMAFFRELVEHHYNPFLPGTISQFGAPAGIPIPWPRDLASAPETLTLYLLTTVFGTIPAYGLYTLAGYTLTGTVTFLFARRLTANTWAALIAGWAFAFYPFADINGQGHLDFVHGWLLVLALWRMVELMWHPTRRNGLLAGLAVTLCMWWSPYFILFGGVLYVVATAVALFVAWRARCLRTMLVPQLIAALIVCVFIAGLGVLSSAGEIEGIGTRMHSTQELNFYAARPLEYFVPDVQSPLFGSDTRPYLETYPLAGSGIETTLYVGATVVLLALAALAAFVRRRLAPRLARAVLALALIAVVGIISSMQPEVRLFGVAVPFPSHFIAQITTTWRVYSRFVIVVMLAFSLLAAVGLDVLTRRRASWLKIGVMSLATIAIPLDLWAPQHGHVTRISTPAIYKTLAREPMGIVAEYPLAASSFNSYSDIFYQSAYGKPLIGGYLEGSFQERLSFSLADLSDPSTAPRLATLGVRYVLLDATPASWGAWPAAGEPGAGFRLIARGSYADLYRVTARPRSPALVAAGAGFGATLLTTGSVNWLERTSGTIDLVGTCTSCNGVLSMTLASYSQPHKVTVFDDHGRVLARGTVGASARVAIPLHFSRHTALRLVATPGPQPVSDTEGSPSVSVEVVNLEFASARQVGTHKAAHESGGGGAG